MFVCLCAYVQAARHNTTDTILTALTSFRFCGSFSSILLHFWYHHFKLWRIHIFFRFLFTHLQVRDHLTLSGLQLIPMKVANVTVLNIKSKSKLGLKVSNMFKQRPTFCCRSFYLNESKYLSYFLLDNCNCFLNAKFIGNEYSMQFAFTWSLYIFRNSIFVKKKWVKPHEIWLFLRKTSKFNADVWQNVGRSWRIYAWYLSGRMVVGHPIQNTCHYCVHFKRRTCQHTFTKTCSTKDIEIMMRNNTVQVYTR